MKTPKSGYASGLFHLHTNQWNISMFIQLRSKGELRLSLTKKCQVYKIELCVILVAINCMIKNTVTSNAEQLFVCEFLPNTNILLSILCLYKTLSQWMISVRIARVLGEIKKELKCADKNIILNYKAAKKNSKQFVMGSSTLHLQFLQFNR